MIDANTTQLRDIKPLVEIPDYSFYLYWGLVLVAVVITLLAVYLGYRKWLEHREQNRQKQYLEVLNSIDWTSPKKAAYRATHYGRLLCKDERREKLFEQMLPELEKYKYKKEVQGVDEETMRAFELFKKVCNESV